MKIKFDKNVSDIDAIILFIIAIFAGAGFGALLAYLFIHHLKYIIIMIFIYLIYAGFKYIKIE